MKLIVGWVAHSPALIADGFHSLSDLLTDGAVVLFSRWGQAEPDEEYPYGHHRYETLGTVILGTSLIVIASAIAWDSLVALWYQTHAPEPSGWAIVIAISSIVAKEWVFRFTLRVAKTIKSNLLEANAWHSRSDALSSLVVLVGVLATWWGYAWVELWTAVLVAILIGKMGVDLTWNASQDLVDRGIDIDSARDIEKLILDTPGVVDVHRLRSRKMANQIYLDVHIQVGSIVSVSEGHFVAEQVMERIHGDYDDVSDITVHVDYEEDFDDGITHQRLPDRQAIEAELQQLGIIPQRLQIHYLNQRVQLELFFQHYPEDWQQRQRALTDWQQQQPWLSRCETFSQVVNSS